MHSVVLVWSVLVFVICIFCIGSGWGLLLVGMVFFWVCICIVLCLFVFVFACMCYLLFFVFVFFCDGVFFCCWVVIYGVCVCFCVWVGVFVLVCVFVFVFLSIFAVLLKPK